MTFVLGAPVHHRELFADRYLRPFDASRPHRYFENPCEMAPRIDGASSRPVEPGRRGG